MTQLIYKAWSKVRSWISPDPKFVEINFTSHLLHYQQNGVTETVLMGKWLNNRDELNVVKWEECERTREEKWVAPMVTCDCRVSIKQQHRSDFRSFLYIVNFLCNDEDITEITGWLEYPNHITNTLSLCTESILMGTKIEIGTWKTANNFIPITTDTDIEFKAVFKFQNNKCSLRLYVLMSSPGKEDLICFEFNTHSLVYDVAICTKRSEECILITYRNSPLIYRQAEMAIQKTNLKNADRSNSSQRWTRICNTKFREPLGECDTIKLECIDFENLLLLSENFLKASFKCRFQTVKVTKCNSIPDMSKIALKEAYLFSILNSHGLKLISKMTPSLIDYMLQSNEDEYLWKEAFVQKMIQETVTRDNWYMVVLDESVIQWIKENRFKKYAHPRGNILIKKATITPTRVRLEFALTTEMNRILNENPDSSEYFMTVQFRDEDFISKLSNPPEELVKPIIAQRLYGGLLVAGRRFHYLGGSNSQLKEHSCYLYAPDQSGKDAQKLRDSIGDMTNIRCVAKLSKRLGQAFSSSRGDKAFKVRPSCSIEIEPDIKWTDEKTGNAYCFSDGIGKISISMAQKVKMVLFWKLHETPSGFQIRLGGAKGVLAVDPLLGRRDRIILRDSMIKFDSMDTYLYVQDVSKAKELNLNHQIITLLSQQGVTDETFHRLQEHAIKKVMNILLNERVAREELKREVPAFPWKHIYLVVDSVFEVPLFRRILVEIVRRKLYPIIKKAKIPIPKGNALMGVLDETGELKYGEVYFSTPKTHNSPFTGLVIISKMPCLHPGDVRKFTAVDCPQLGHMRDVIVFPQKGPRPHPDEMAGSDLDGDLYWVTWDSRLVKEFRKGVDNFSAMDYTGQPEKTQEGPITENDLIDHVIHFIQTDITSIVSRAHLCRADNEGIFSENCIRLADLHSRAVDAPKTGENVKLPEELTIKNYPDFLGKEDHKTTYRSERILGKLYRQYKDIYEALQALDQEPKWIAQEKNKFYSNQSTKATANDAENVNFIVQNLQSQFEKTISFLLKKYKLTEVELLTGNVFNSKNRINQGDPFKLIFEIKDEVKCLFNETRRKLDKGTYGDSLKKQIAISVFDSKESSRTCCFQWLFCEWLPKKHLDTKLGNAKEIRHSMHYRNGKTLKQLIRQLKESKSLNFKDLLPKLLPKEQIRTFEDHPWISIVYIFYALALEFQVPADDRNDYASQMISLAKVVIEQAKLLDDTFCASPASNTSIVEKFRKAFQTLISSKFDHLISSVGKYLDVNDANLDIQVRKSGELAFNLLVDSFNKVESEFSNPLQILDSTLRSTLVVHILVMNDTAISDLIKWLLRNPGSGSIRVKQLFISGYAKSVLSSGTNSLQTLQDLGLRYHIEDSKINLKAPVLILRSAENIIEKLNQQQTQTQPARGAPRRGREERICYNCNQAGHIRLDCPSTMPHIHVHVHERTRTYTQ